MSVNTHEFQEDGMEFNDKNLMVKAIFLNPDDSISSSSSQGKINLPLKHPREENEYDPALKYKKEILSLMFNQSQRTCNSKASASKKSRIYEEDIALSIPDEGSEEYSSSLKNNDTNDLSRRRKELFPKKLPKSKPSKVSVAYICKGPDYKGKFIPEAAKALADLVKGKSVTTPDGTIIHPHQVIGPSRAGLHVIINEKYCPQRIMFYSSAISQLKLSKIDEKQFHIPYYSNEPLSKLDLVPNIPVNSKISAPLLIYQTEPSFKIDESNLPRTFDHIDQNSEAVRSLNDMEEYLNVAKQVQQEIAVASPNMQNFPGKDITIITLGTGSTLPSKYRNVSSTLISIPDNGNILLDVGEGTYSSLVRHLGSYGEINGGQTGVNEFLNSLKCIFISHMHADHHLGLIRVLSKWNELHNDDNNVLIHVIGPSRLWKWLNELSDVQDFGYSGDTRPCDDLVRVGKNATLLIHEATFENDLIEEALNKKHSTTEEAVKIGERMNARFILLTHFSQRYPKVPVFTDDHGKVGISFDFMQITIGDLYKAPKYLKAIKLLYSEDSEEAKDEEYE
ncbi:2252_t:CDS:2 [Acaulospora colombiana]|uniref:2252_t:CDS:1 n=1 Tax=Acaulospora colombiana TaxID=27376 RepID=A0ACA9LDJ4_9GLOM|nr:2252_t:CDS:2 [Acaulospora colombiana]